MKNNTNESKEKNQKGKKKTMDTKKVIGIDQPFDYAEVVSITGPEYVQHLRRDGVSTLPYEELKENAPGFYLPEDQCIWMRAGIINLRLCDGENDCHHCPFDQAMRIAMGKISPPERKEKRWGWATQMKEKYQIIETPCIHFKLGRIASPELCTVNYECHRCGVHQMLQSNKQREGTGKPTVSNVSGFQVAGDYYYHIGHSWAHIEHDGWVRVGVDDFASKIFGPAHTIQLPAVGDFLMQGDIGWVINRNGHQAPMQSPLSGTVRRVNDHIGRHPEMLQENPYEKGWLFLLDPANLKIDLGRLYFGKESFQWIEKEQQHLTGLLGPVYEQLAATGGRTIDDIFGRFPDIEWDRLVKTFLYTAEKDS